MENGHDFVIVTDGSSSLDAMFNNVWRCLHASRLTINVDEI